MYAHIFGHLASPTEKFAQNVWKLKWPLFICWTVANSIRTWMNTYDMMSISLLILRFETLETSQYQQYRSTLHFVHVSILQMTSINQLIDVIQFQCKGNASNEKVIWYEGYLLREQKRKETYGRATHQLLHKTGWLWIIDPNDQYNMLLEYLFCRDNIFSLIS